MKTILWTITALGLFLLGLALTLLFLCPTAQTYLG